MRTIIVAIPSGGAWQSEFCTSLVKMVMEAGSIPDAQFGFANRSGSMLVSNRHRLVIEARKMDATHILWLDDDMTFPETTLHRLLDHGKPIVACNATTRTVPPKPVAVKGGQRVRSVGASGLAEVDHVGMAVMLTESRVFDAIPEPWFQFGWHPKDREYIGEDVFFCRRAREAGFPILIDHDLSREIGHVGNFTYTHDLTE